MFKLGDIKAGYLLKVKDLETREEFYMTVAPGSNRHTGEADGTLGCCSKSPLHFWPLEQFGALVNPEDKDHTILAVYGYTHNRYLLDCSPEDRDLLWERKEPKKMTVAEICKALGYDVEIVKEG